MNSAVRILIADDHVTIRQGLHAELAVNSLWEVCGEAENGKEAVQMVLELKPDLVILNISLSIVSGIEACRQIRQLVPDIRILLYAAHSSPQSKLELIAQQAGANGFLSKSVSVTSLTKAVERVLRNPGR